MPLSRELQYQAEDLITTSIYTLIDRYLSEGLNIYDIEKYFRMNKSFNILLKDINYAGRRFFDDIDDYNGFVKKILNDVILDKKSYIETNKLTENTIKKYSEYLNESILNINNDDLTIDYLFSDLEYSDDDKDILSDVFETKEEYITSKNAKYCIYTITNFETNVLKNNRMNFNVLLLSKYQFIKMRDNVIRKIISEIYSKIPDNIDFMGIRVKPHTIMDKKRLKESLLKLIIDDEVISLITNLTNYTFYKNYNDYYIWKKENN
jgi:hypothetical protein